MLISKRHMGAKSKSSSVQPSRLLLKLSQHLFPDEGDRQAFLDRLINPQPFNPCILWCQPRPETAVFRTESPLAWQPDFVDRLSLGQKPGQHPFHQQGYFYCLDFSSVFAIAPLLSLSQPLDLVVDLCAAPGGKSIFAWVSLRPHLLISNEVIGKRSGTLIANLKRCQVQPAVITRLDPKFLAAEIPKTASVVLVDAPCSGQSLLAKGSKAPGCFHPATLNLNANRQKRILANAAQLVAPQGHLLYMTCTYSPDENEYVMEWFLKHFPQFQLQVIPFLETFQSPLSPLPCYRMWPQQGLGAGAFTALFVCQSGNPKNAIPDSFWERPNLTYL